MPGGAAAIREPWRMAASYLLDAYDDPEVLKTIPAIRRVDAEALRIGVQMVKQRIHAPMTSSLGRLFDGIASILGIRNRVRYEGQAALELEGAATSGDHEPYGFAWTEGDPLTIPTGPVIRGVVRDLEAGLPPGVISGRFHATVTALFSDLCAALSAKTGIRRVVLSGGVFQNAILLKGFLADLGRRGLEVYSHAQVPANDGGIALGQAMVAAWRRG